MLARIGRVGVAVLILASLISGSGTAARGATRTVPARFTALDNGAAVAPHVKVTAMTTAPGGALYAAGVYVVRNKDPYAVNPVTSLGSTWLVSHDHGATWTQDISTTDPKAFPKSGVAPWTNHAALPIDFTPMGITVDPRNPRIIYVAGCVDIDATCSSPTVGTGEHLVIRSINGGKTWQDLLTTTTPILGVSAKPRGTALPTSAYSVLVDPSNSRRLYVAVNDLGVLRSEDAGRSWIYAPQPQSNFIGRPCELLADPRNPRIVYELAREGALYRTTDAGKHWQVRSLLGGQLHAASVSSLTWVKHALYITSAKGLYASNDGGIHWHLVIPSPPFGSLTQSVRAASGWVAVLETTGLGRGSGVYVAPDRGVWRLAADTTIRGPKGYGALDFEDTGTYLATRLWEYRPAGIIFTSAPLGGLYRWQSTL